MRSWLGSDRTISRTLGLLIPHSGLSSLYYVSFFCGNKVSEEKQGGSPTKFKKYYPVAPSFTFLFLRLNVLVFQLFIKFSCYFFPQTY